MVRLVSGLLLVALLLVGLAACASAGQTHAFVLLPDAEASAGALPEELHLQAGDTLQIQNNDDVPRQIGALLLAPGDTLTQRFPGPGRFEYSCSVHAGGRLVVVVEQ